VACRPRGAGGLGLRFEADAEGVRAEFACDLSYQGYPDRVHGGVIATLLDAAMTHCLFARQVRGYTVRLNIRFHAPLQLGPPAIVRAAVSGARPPLYLLRAEVRQADRRCASAEASFFGERNPDPSSAAH